MSCASSIRRQSRASAGTLGVVLVVDDGKQLLDPAPPDRRHDTELRRCARNAFDSWVRWRLSINRTRCNIITLCCSGVFTGTKRMVGRVTASQMASASAASFFCRFK